MLVAGFYMEYIGVFGLDVALVGVHCRSRTFSHVQGVFRGGQGDILFFCQVEINEFLLRDFELAHTLRHYGVFGCHCPGEGVACNPSV